MTRPPLRRRATAGRPKCAFRSSGSRLGHGRTLARARSHQGAGMRRRGQPVPGCRSQLAAGVCGRGVTGHRAVVDSQGHDCSLPSRGHGSASRSGSGSRWRSLPVCSASPRLAPAAGKCSLYQSLAATTITYSGGLIGQPSGRSGSSSSMPYGSRSSSRSSWLGCGRRTNDFGRAGGSGFLVPVWAGHWPASRSAAGWGWRGGGRLPGSG